MPRVGSSKRKTRALPSSHFASTTFCCVPPERLRTSCSVPGVRICSSSIMRRRRRPLARERRSADRGRRIRRDARASRFRARVMPEHEPLRLAIFGDEGDAGGDGARGCGRPHAASRRPQSRRASGASAPAIARTISVRPAPIRPASPTISPARTAKRDVVHEAARARSPRTSSASGASGGELRQLGEVRVELPARPSPRRSRRAGNPRRARVSTILPSRITVTRSAIRGSSSMRCEM